MPKRKRTKSEVPEACKSSLPTCILHVQTPSDNGHFISLSSIKGNAVDKLEHLQTIRNGRLQLPHSSPYRMQSVCDQIPTCLPDDLSNIGYHRTCYQRFTCNLHRLRDADTEAQPPTAGTSQHYSPRKNQSTCSSGPIFPPDCIFCGKIETKDASRNTERPVSFSSFRNKENAWEQIEEQAEKMELYSLYRKVKNIDLFACEAKHHVSCFKSFRSAFANYERKVENAIKGTEETRQADLSSAHDNAIQSVLQHVKIHIIQNNELVRLNDLRLIYIDALKQRGYENTYRSEKLLNRLQKHDITAHIHFTKVNQNKLIYFWLIHSSKLTVSDALANAYSLGSIDRFEDAAFHIRQEILMAFRESDNVPWPPTVDDLELSFDKVLPPALIRFLCLVIAGKEDFEISEKVKRLVHSLGQDLCRAVSDGKWKLPKHTLFCMTIRHLTRSRQLTTILNRFGHSEGYDFGLELETALANALDEASTYLTPQIVKGEGNCVFHCEWDNLNKITTNVLGNNIVNSAGGIMVQEVRPGFQRSQQRMLPIVDKSQQRSLAVDVPETLPPLQFTRVGPQFPAGSSFKPPAENETVFANNIQVYYVWLLCRCIGSNESSQYLDLEVSFRPLAYHQSRSQL